jgi:pimeloyl-ACP methyl ester carboxylesterase
MGKLALKITAGVAAGVVALVAVLLAGSWLALRRGDIPYDTLQTRWAAEGSRYIDLPGGVRVHYLDQGDPKGRTLVLLHGFAMSTDTWKPWVKRLGRDFHVVSLDLPGFGLTRVPADWPYSYQAMAGVVDAFAKAKHLDRFSIAGSSMGGGVAWRYALNHPERVRGLILVDSTGWPAPVSPAEHDPLVRAGKSRALRPIVTSLDDSSSLRRIFRAAYADPSRVDTAYVTRYAELSRAPGRRAVWLNLLADWNDQDFATPERLAELQTPTLILWGGKDRLFPLADGRRFVAAIPGAHLIVYPKVGHMPQEEAAGASAADVAAFLHGLEPSAKKAGLVVPPPTQPVTKPDPKQMVFY